MLWIYLLAAALIAWGLCRDLFRGETWLIGFGRIVRQHRPAAYWLTIALRGFILLAVIAAAALGGWR